MQKQNQKDSWGKYIFAAGAVLFLPTRGRERSSDIDLSSGWCPVNRTHNRLSKWLSIDSAASSSAKTSYSVALSLFYAPVSHIVPVLWQMRIFCSAVSSPRHHVSCSGPVWCITAPLTFTVFTQRNTTPEPDTLKTHSQAQGVWFNSGNEENCFWLTSKATFLKQPC